MKHVHICVPGLTMQSTAAETWTESSPEIEKERRELGKWPIPYEIWYLVRHFQVCHFQRPQHEACMTKESKNGEVPSFYCVTEYAVSSRLYRSVYLSVASRSFFYRCAPPKSWRRCLRCWRELIRRWDSERELFTTISHVLQNTKKENLFRLTN